ncbi:hypothetical protein ACQZV8_20240, partial [Magnetococcales bacterium HHB-1]
NGNALPQAYGWRASQGNAKASINQGTLHLVDGSSEGGSYLQYFKSWGAQRSGYINAAEVVAKIDYNASTHGMYFGLSTGTHKALYTLYHNKIVSTYSYWGDKSYALDASSQFNTYTATIDSTGYARLFVNGELVMEHGTAQGTHNVVGIEFGAGSSRSTGDAWFDNVCAYQTSERIIQRATKSQPTEIPLSIAAQKEGEAPEEITVMIEGLPEDATLSAGTDLGQGTYRLNGDQLENLILTLPKDFDAQHTIKITAAITDESGITHRSAGTLMINRQGAVEQTKTIQITDAVGVEDQAIPLHIALPKETPADYSLVLSNIPKGATLSAGEKLADGSWQLTAEQLDELTLTPSEHDATDLNLFISDASGTLLNIPLNVTLSSVVDLPTLSITTGDVIRYTEEKQHDQPTLLFEYTADRLPEQEGWQTKHGTLSPQLVDGMLLIDDQSSAGGSYQQYWRNWQEQPGLTTVIEADIRAIDNSQSLYFGLSDGDNEVFYWLNDGHLALIEGEAEPIPLTTNTFHFQAYILDGVAKIYIDGQLVAEQDNLPHYYSYVESGIEFGSGSSSGQGAAFFDNIKAYQVASDQVDNLFGDTALRAISLNIDTALTDNDGSESLTITLEGLHQEATLSNGSDLGGGVWQLTPDQLTDLQLILPANITETQTIQITATAEEIEGDRATVTNDLVITLDGDLVQAESSVRDGAIFEGGDEESILMGSDGDDTLSGGLGDDLLTGGQGNDLFVFFDGHGSDTIQDFQAGAGTEDRIDLMGV